MPREDRRIIFDNSEAYQAVYALCVKRDMKKPPPGTITAVTQDTEDQNQVLIRIENQQDKTAAVKKYSRDFIAAALMLSCRGSGIPLPKMANKSVMFVDEGVVLRVTM